MLIGLSLPGICVKTATNFLEEVEGLLTKGSQLSLQRLVQRCGLYLVSGTERPCSLLLDQNQLRICEMILWSGEVQWR